MADDIKGTIAFIAGEMLAIKRHAAKTRSSLSNRHQHLLRRITDLEERLGETEGTIDELKSHLLHDRVGLTDSAGGTPSRNGASKRRLHSDPIIPGSTET